MSKSNGSVRRALIRKDCPQSQGLQRANDRKIEENKERSGRRQPTVKIAARGWTVIYQAQVRRIRMLRGGGKWMERHKGGLMCSFEYVWESVRKSERTESDGVVDEGSWWRSPRIRWQERLTKPQTTPARPSDLAESGKAHEMLMERRRE